MFERPGIDFLSLVERPNTLPVGCDHHGTRARARPDVRHSRAMRETSVATVVTDIPSSAPTSSLLHGGDARANSKSFVNTILDFNLRRALVASCVGLSALVGCAMHARASSSSTAALGDAKGVDLLIGQTKFPRTVKLLPRDAPERAFETTKSNWNLYHVDGDKDVERGVMHDFADWPTDELREASINLKVKDSAAYEAFDAIHSEFERLNADRINARADVGPAFSALLAWEKAKEEGLSSLIIATPDAYINSHCGPPLEFDSFILSFLLRGPKKWDVLFLDRGERGVNEDNLRHPEALFSNKAWEKPYVLYKNTATIVGEALPSNFYMVSKSFMDGISAHLKATPLTNVDWWINRLCENGDLECFSYNAENWYDGLTSERKAKMGEPHARAPIVDTTPKVDATPAVVESAENVTASVADASAESVKESQLGVAQRPESVVRSTRVVAASEAGKFI